MCECICMTRVLANSGALCHHKAVSYSSGISVVHNSVMFIKGNKNIRVSSYLASELAGVLRADKDLPTLNSDNTLVTFVPRGRKGVIKHGVDQSEILSGELAKAMGLPCLACLTRVRGGKEQKRLSAAQRAKNVKKLYAPIESLESAVGGKNVIIIDDVVTTGASMAACVSYLIRAGARKVIALSLASTEENK